MTVKQGVSVMGMAGWPVILTGWPAGRWRWAWSASQQQMLSGTGVRVLGVVKNIRYHISPLYIVLTLPYTCTNQDNIWHGIVDYSPYSNPTTLVTVVKIKRRSILFLQPIHSMIWGVVPLLQASKILAERHSSQLTAYNFLTSYTRVTTLHRSRQPRYAHKISTRDIHYLKNILSKCQFLSYLYLYSLTDHVGKLVHKNNSCRLTTIKLNNKSTHFLHEYSITYDIGPSFSYSRRRTCAAEWADWSPSCVLPNAFLHNKYKC